MEAPPNKQESLRWATDALTFSLSGRKFVLARRDRDAPHLTLSWGNRSGEVDLHLTYSDGRHEGLVAVPSAYLEGIGATFEQFAIACMEPLVHQSRPLRPGWLERQGYVVIVPEEEQVLRWLKPMAPKERGKYRLNIAGFDEQMALGIVENAIYSPRILKVPGIQKRSGLVFAVGRPGSGLPKLYVQWLPYDQRRRLAVGHPPDTRVPILPVCASAWDGSSTRWRWVGLPEHRILHAVRLMNKGLIGLLGAVLPPRALGIIEHVAKEMDLDSIPALADPLNDVRQFLQNPPSFEEPMAERSGQYSNGGRFLPPSPDDRLTSD